MSSPQVPYTSMWGPGGPFPTGQGPAAPQPDLSQGPNGPRAFPAPPNFHDWLAGQFGNGVNDLPDNAYQAMQEKFFQDQVLPWGAQQGHALEPLQEQFMQATQRPGKSEFPRTQALASQALASLTAPLKVLDPGPAAQAQRWADDSAKEAAKQGISPGPYQWLGDQLGTAPYWGIGMGAAGEAMGAAKLGEGLLRKALIAGTGGLIQGAYDAAKASDQGSARAISEGFKGAAMGTAITAVAEPLIKFLLGKGLTPEQAEAVQASVKGLATPEQEDVVAQTVPNKPYLDMDLRDYVAEQIRGAKTAGVPTEASVGAPDGRLKMKVIGADGKPYNLGGVTGTKLQDFGSVIDRLAQHLNGGGSIESIGGDPAAQNFFLGQIERINNGSFKLEVPEGGAQSTLDSATHTMENDTIPSKWDQSEWTGGVDRLPFKSKNLNDIINARNSVYHATDLEGMRGILESGQIDPTQLIPDSKYGEAAKAYESDKWDEFVDNLSGVSVSRTPRLASKADKAITFVIDQDKMPRTRPFVEEGYEKTISEPTAAPSPEGYKELAAKYYASKPPGDWLTEDEQAQFDQLHQQWLTEAKTRNPHFEFEQRTYNEPIPLSAVKGILVDKEALGSSIYQDIPSKKWIVGDRYANSEEEAKGFYDSQLAQVKQLANQHNIPIRFVENGNELHSYRAGISREDPMYAKKLTEEDVPWLDRLTGGADRGLVQRVEDLFDKGLMPDEIAKATGLSENDVNRHLQNYVEKSSKFQSQMPPKAPAQGYTEPDEGLPFAPDALKSKGLVRGSIDIPLNARGKAKADLNGRRMAGQFDRLLSDDLSRSIQTRDAMAKYNPQASIDPPDPRWRSWARGSFEGGDPDVAKQFSDSLVRDGAWDTPHPGMAPGSTQPGESFHQFAYDVLGAHKDLAKEWLQEKAQTGKSPLYGVFTHYNPIRLIEAETKGGDNHLGVDFEHYLGNEPDPGMMFHYDPETNKMSPFHPESDTPEPGIMYMRHEDTNFNPVKGDEGAEPGYKSTPLAHRFVAEPGQVKGFDEGDMGMTLPGRPDVKPTVVYGKNVDRSTIHHEMIHAHANYLGLHGWFDDNLTGNDVAKDLYDSNLKQLGYQQRGSGEEAFAYTSEAIRTADKRKLGIIAKADTDEEHVLNWYTQSANDLMDRTAELPDSLHKRTLERRINYTISQASGMLNDVKRPFEQTHDIDYDPESNEWTTYNKQTGTTHHFDNRDAALSYLEYVGAQEPLNSPELVDTSSLPEFPRFARRLGGPSNSTSPIHTDPPPPSLSSDSVSKGIMALSSMVRPFYNWIGSTAKKLGREDLSSAFYSVDDAQTQLANAVRPITDALNETINRKPYRADGYTRQTDFMKYITAITQTDRDNVIRESHISAEELGDLQQYEDRVFNQVPGLKQYIQERVPEMKANDWNVDTRYPQNLSEEVSPETQVEGDLIRRGRLDPRDTNLLRVTAAYMQGRYWHDIVKDPVDAADDIVNAKTGDEYDFGLLRPILNRQLQYYRGVPDYTQKLVMDAVDRMTQLYNQGVDKLNEKVLPDWFKLNHIEEGPRDVLNNLILFNYAGALALRPMVPIRDSLQLFLTSFPILGEKYIWQGMRRAWSGEGDSLGRDAYESALRNGWLIERTQLPEMIAGGGETHTIEGKVENWVKSAMSVISYAHNSNRLVAGWGHTLKMMDALEDFANTGDRDAFIRQSDLWFLDPAKRDLRVREAGQIAGNKDAYESYALRTARDLVDATQWNYRRGASPGIYKYQLGRLFGQYGTWPLNYIEYARRYGQALTGDYRQQAAMALTRLGITHGAVLSGMAALGIDAAHWTFTQPMAYGGGPLFQAITSIPESMDFQTYKGAEARRNLIEPLWPGMIPGYEETHGLFQAITDDSKNAWLRALGFTPMSDKSENTGWHKFVP